MALNERKRTNSFLLKQQSDSSEDNADRIGDPDEAEAAMVKQVLIERVRGNAKKFRDDIVGQLDNHLSGMLSDFATEVEKVGGFQSQVFHTDHNSTKRGEKGQLKDKEFLPRNSLLTDLFEVSHIQTIHHMSFAVLLLLFLNTVIYDYVDTGTFHLDFKLISWAFGSFNSVIAIWVMMNMGLLLVLYPGFCYWSSHRQEYKRWWDVLFLFFYIVYLGLAFYLPVSKLLEQKLPPASSVVVLTEQIRLIMKSHAFVRTNAAKVLKYHSAEDKEKVGTPEYDFSKFLYFLFAPTLVYRDHYPRNTHIRWYYVLSNFGQVLGCTFYTYFMIAWFCVPIFRKFGQEPISTKNLVLSVFGCMMPGSLIMICGFFAVLHAWLNAFAEMLTFADRMFYKDWWNCTSFSAYYRTWNIVVHDWLFAYVYKDVYELKPTNRILPLLTVFTVSALIHEYIVTYTFRFFYPLLYVMFGGFGVMLIFMTEKKKARGWNVFMWISLFMGTGLLMSLYSMEWYARINCPPYDDTILDYLIPRSWTCYQQNHQPTESSFIPRIEL